MLSAAVMSTSNDSFRIGRLLPAVGLGLISVVMACSGAESTDAESQGASALTAVPAPDPVDDDAAEAATADAAACAPAIDRFRELEIVHPNVVNSAQASNARDGRWSFRFLVEQMRPAGVTTSDFVLNMLKSWETTQLVNGLTLEARNIRSVVTQPWLDASGGDGTVLDMAKAPFKLMAIVNRLDLHTPDCKSAGEGRFVFNVTTQSGSPLSFTVIFEYHLPTTATVTPHVWAQRWHQLHKFDITKLDTTPDDAGAPPDDYNQQLLAITDLFTKRNSLPGAPNGNAISQVRTNEIAIGSPWQLREFHLVADAAGKGFLVPSTTAQSATQVGLNNTATLHDFLADNKAKINNGTVLMPAKFTNTINGITTTVPFLGGESNEDGSPWQSTDPVTTRNPQRIDATTLKNFSFLTCNGCHQLQGVQTAGFYHVDPFTIPDPNGGPTAGSERLSPFLVGRASPPVPSDLTRRAKVMQGLLCAKACPGDGAGLGSRSGARRVRQNGAGTASSGGSWGEAFP